MLCNHCKKEQETITIAGKTYCANCSTILSDKKVSDEEVPKHKMPKLETTDNDIRTQEAQSKPIEINSEVQEVSRESKIPEVNKDDLEGSAILLDILSDNAKDSSDNKTLEADKKLEEASEEILDLLGKPSREEPPKKTKPMGTQRKGNGVMNDIVPSKIGKRNDFMHKKHSSVVKDAEKEIKDEVANIGRIVTSESGYTKEYDMMILSIALTAIAMVILAIFMTFR